MENHEKTHILFLGLDHRLLWQLTRTLAHLEDRIVIELPGLLDKERAVQLIGQTALLEFKLVHEARRSQGEIENLDRKLARAQMAAEAERDSGEADYTCS